MAKKKIVQQPPFTVLIEPTEGCNLGVFILWVKRYA